MSNRGAINHGEMSQRRQQQQLHQLLLLLLMPLKSRSLTHY